MSKKEKNFSVIILAAGQGTRMKSPLPKVLHPVAGRPMIERIVSAVQKAGAEEVRVVVGHGENLVRQVVEPLGATCLKQEKQLGTADAVKAAQPESMRGTVLILSGDHPLITTEDVQKIMESHFDGKRKFSLVTVTLDNPGQYGRVVRHKGFIQAIVEAKDASSETLKIKEVNPSIYVLDVDLLNAYLPKIDNHNAQQEFYFTDMVSLCREDNIEVEAIRAPEHVGFGVNTQRELAEATQRVFRRNANRLMDEGVVIIDPSSTYIEDSVSVGKASVIYPGSYLLGQTQIGSFCVIEPNCFIARSRIGDSVQIKAGSYVESSQILDKAKVGPYARIRGGGQIGEECEIGNFVEVKNSSFGKKSKAKHLAYLGDAEVGEETNVGCGVITCNYAVDRKKYVTKIGKGVFVGSDVQFVAPVSIGDEAIIGSGSTITKDVPAKALAIARGRQFIKENYQPQSPQQSEEEKSKESKEG
ncbi:MAG: UDP-N-acetylglucosamine diphosphorylase/glucosamine-1-phosphate N-acetyltransferase [Bdellovibrio sp.]|nr:MAG: UDP-N-acetylglucosamine diphosphorylase/glucosamine-1-phosphate N-acetyltransferase [Bdellovibrio sp.]